MAALRVLLVDDDTILRDLLQQILELNGCAVTTAENGEAALARLADHPPDLVVTDLQMPIMAGDQLAERIRALGLDIPVVLLSGDTALDAEAPRQRAAACLAKPCAVEELLQTVRRLAPALRA
jgi:CheY-like chemotaxis protein